MDHQTRPRRRRRLTASGPVLRRRSQSFSSDCRQTFLPHSLDPLDLTSRSPTPSLASLRLLVLSHLADVESRLVSSQKQRSLDPCQETREEETSSAWLQDGKDMLARIRADVCSYLPDLQLDVETVESLVKAHLPHIPDLSVPDLSGLVPSLSVTDFEMPDISFEDVKSRISEIEIPFSQSMRSRIDDVRSQFSDLGIDLHQPLDYLPVLSEHLQSLHAHLSESSISFSPNGLASQLLDRLMSSSFVSELLQDDLDDQTQAVEAKAAVQLAKQVAIALKSSLDGQRLINYTTLPDVYKNNEFVTEGYRFIPLKRWPLLLLSIFTFHNETIHIHTHLLPLLLALPLDWLSVQYVVQFFSPSQIQDTIYHRGSSNSPVDLPERIFMLAAHTCLLCSVVWHTLAGCADFRTADLAGRVDFVGIGWLISASVASIVYYGFSCRHVAAYQYLAMTLITGILGSILPFMAWFNERKAKKWRILFFLCIALTGLAPLVHLSLIHSSSEMSRFIDPLLPSFASYLIGLLFYGFHFPECVLPARARKWTDWIGGGSHTIWHCFIISGIQLHRRGMANLRSGIGGESCE
ncbi:hypothetical protein SISSUDRAFT_1124609, partial [Sistotremastrum suecicum HHB10207 ss-3]